MSLVISFKSLAEFFLIALVVAKDDIAAFEKSVSAFIL